jgi:hypothetical protein
MGVSTTEAVSIIWVLCAILASAIAAPKGKAGLGFFLGLILGVVGVIIAAVMKDERVEQQPVMFYQSSAPGWWPDPHRRHEYRFFDGWRWTEHVSNHGAQSDDIVG